MATRPTKRSPTPTSGKSTTPRRAAAKPTAAASMAPSAATPKVVTVAPAVVTVAEMRKKELIDTVVARSGIKKKDAKPVVEAMLAVLGETIADGRKLNLQPLGKMKINRVEDKANSKVIICRLRQALAAAAGPTPPPANPLADAAE